MSSLSFSQLIPRFSGQLRVALRPARSLAVSERKCTSSPVLPRRTIPTVQRTSQPVTVPSLRTIRTTLPIVQISTTSPASLVASVKLPRATCVLETKEFLGPSLARSAIERETRRGRNPSSV